MVGIGGWLGPNWPKLMHAIELVMSYFLES